MKTDTANSESDDRPTDTIHAAHEDVVAGLGEGDRVELEMVGADDHGVTVRATVEEVEGTYYVLLGDLVGPAVDADGMELHQSLGNQNKYVAAKARALGNMHAHRIRVLN